MTLVACTEENDKKSDAGLKKEMTKWRSNRRGLTEVAFLFAVCTEKLLLQVASSLTLASLPFNLLAGKSSFDGIDG